MTISQKKEKLDIAAFTIAVCVFLKLQPWFTWGMNNYVIFGVIPSIYLLAIVPNLDIKGGKLPLLLTFFALLLFLVLIQGYGASFSLSILSFCFVPFIKDLTFNKTLRYFEIILAVFYAGGLLYYFAVLFNVPLSNFQITSLNFEEFSSGYTVYPPFLVKRNFLLDFYRFCGPFDEPGVVGTSAVFVLCAERYNLRKWPVLIIFLGACFSLSFMFVVGTLVFLVFTYVKKRSRVILVVLFIVAFYLVTKDIPVFRDMVYARFEWDSESGKLAGDNRYSDAQKDYVVSIRGSNDYLFGDHGKTKGDFGFARSYLDAILSYGFVFCFLYILWFAIYARFYNRSWYETSFFLIILLINLYQRPNFISYTYIFLYTAFIRNRVFDCLPNSENKVLLS